MVFEINEHKNSKLDEVFEESIAELIPFFGFEKKPDKPNLVIVNDRKTIDSLKGRKTERWYVGWAEGRNIYLLSDKTYEKQSSHKYSDEEYFALMKHELAHFFTNQFCNKAKIPVWLSEGIAIHLSGQNKLKKKPTEYRKFLEFYSERGVEVYHESGFAVEFLVERYGKNKLLDLLRRVGEFDSETRFKKLFKSIYCFGLSYKNFKIL